MDRASLTIAADHAAGSRATGLAAAGAAAVLAPIAWAADRAAGLSPLAISVDLGLGLALAASGLLGRPRRQGLWVSLIGVGWLLGSVAPQTATLSRGLLLLALLAFPTGLVRGRWGIWPYGLAVLVALPGCPQPVVAVVFGGLAVLLVRDSSRRGAQPLAAVVALGSALTQATGWVAVAGDAAELVPVAGRGYQFLLAAVALGFPWASRTATRRMVDSVSGADARTDPSEAPLDRLAALLGSALGDRSLRVSSSDELGASAAAAGRDPSRRRLAVEDAGRQVAVVTSRMSALDDPDTARAVTDAVRLVIRNAALLDQEQQRLGEVTASRARLVEAEDRERAELGALLRTRVSSPLDNLVADLAPLAATVADPASRAAVLLVVEELRGAVAETEAMVSGLPPGELGDGRLIAALEDLARRSPVTMTVDAAAGAIGDEAAETALYAACAEALTNALKHAAATYVACEVRRDHGDLVATLTDDGAGGADPAGSGLQGLADRLAARGGQLRVESPPGAGTTVEARVPARSQSIFS